ncbi:MAG TPA: HAD-IA family hydrolase [Jatrophihabitans sp.]|nr:HAD-IA family hydrolase [Jatrophihabitans sp.]
MIEVVAFDLFGVLAANQPPALKADLAAALGAEPADFWREYWRFRPGYDVAALTDAQYWQSVAGALGSQAGPLAAGQLRRLCELDDASWSGVNEPVVEFAAELAEAGLALGLLSNIPARLAEHLLASHRWLGLFRAAGFSCRLGLAKPDPRAFRWLIEQFGADPARVLYVDDRPENVRAAAGSGLRAVHFTTAADLRAYWHDHGRPALTEHHRSS